MKERIGIFGGTFNPPHIGHIESAIQFQKQLSLDKILIIPAYIPPHKKYISKVTCEERMEMSRLAFSHIKNAEVSDIEIKRGGKSYTYLTLEELKSPDRDLYLLCGTDMFLTLDTWNNADRIFDLARICYVRRENDDESEHLIECKKREYIDKYDARIYPVDLSVTEISSSDIRSNSDLYDKFLSSAVSDFICKRGLYQ